MLMTPTPVLKKAYTPLPGLEALKGKKRKAIGDFGDEDMVDALEN
jgi:hypothetical protein